MFMIRNIDLYHLIPLSLTSMLQGATGSAENKTFDLIFPHTFRLIKMKIGVVMKQIDLKNQILLQNAICVINGNNSSV